MEQTGYSEADAEFLVNGGASQNGRQKASDDLPKKIKAVQVSKVTPTRTEYWWKSFIPKARPTVLAGDPGIGKSALICKICAHLTTGKAFPTILSGEPAQEDFDPVTVCLLTSEDDAGDTIRPRLEVNGADASLVHHVEGWYTDDAKTGMITMQDTNLLGDVLTTYKPGLLVFDPFQAYFGKDIDMNRANQTRPVLEAVDRLCRQYGCTPLFVCHIGKTHREAIYATLGSIDIGALMRSILFLGQDPENEHRRILAHAKVSNARKGQSIVYKMISVEHDIPTEDSIVTVEAPRLIWDGVSNLKADDLSMPAPADLEDRTIVDQAVEFIHELLSNGPVLSSEAEKACKSNGFTVATQRRAKAKLGVQAHRQAVPEGELSEEQNQKRPWEWVLPPQA